MFFPSSCKEYKTALDDLSKTSHAGGDEPPQVARYVLFKSLGNCANNSTEMRENHVLNKQEELTSFL